MKVVVAVTMLSAVVALGQPAAAQDFSAGAADYLGKARALAAAVESAGVSAFRFAGRKAERGVGVVEALIGDAYYYGHGVSRNYAEAVRMYRRAAAKGSAMAQSNLGEIYFYGRGAPQDFAEAVRWWTLAAEANVHTAQLNLSVMLANGDGAPQDYVRAHMYANLAASQLEPGEDQDTAIKNRDIVAKLMTHEQLSEAQRLAREWRPRVAD